MIPIRPRCCTFVTVAAVLAWGFAAMGMDPPPLASSSMALSSPVPPPPPLPVREGAPQPREVIGAVLGKEVYRDELKGNPPAYHDVVQLFMSPALSEYHETHGAKYELTDEEIRQGVDWWTAELRKRGGDEWERWQARAQKRSAELPGQIAEVEAALADPATPEGEKREHRTMLRLLKLEETMPLASRVWWLVHSRKFEQYLYDHYGGGRIIHQQLGAEALDARRTLLLELEADGKFRITDPALRTLAYDYWERPTHPGGFHTDRRLLAFPWTKEFQELASE